MFEARTKVVPSGPIFDGTGPAILRQGIVDARDKTIEEGLNEVQAGTSVFQHPTGRYYGALRVVKTERSAKVEPGRLPYVAWVEGTSSRNRTTRFKGYKVFERAFNRFAAYAVDLFWSHLKPYVDKLR